MKTKTAIKPNETNAYSLIRFSTDKQEWGDSFRRQIERCQAECQRRGWTFDPKLNISDLGVSAFRGKNFDRRFALGKFLEASKANLLLPNPVLIIENLDRFSRDILDNADTEFWGLVKRGVNVLVLSMGGEPYTKGDENNAVKRALVLFEFDRAHRESERKSDLIKSVITNKVTNAGNGLKVCLGNWVPKWVSFKGTKGQPGVYEPNDKWDMVKWIIDAYLSGMSIAAIAKQLRREHKPLLGKNGKKWFPANVRHILGSEALLGHVTVNGETFKNHLPAILNDTQWNQLKEKLRQNTNRKGGLAKKQSIRNLFANRVQCAKCGGAVTVITPGDKHRKGDNGNIRTYYQCRNSPRFGGKCCGLAIPVKNVEEDFFVLFLKEQPTELLGKHNVEHSNKVAEIQSRIALHDKRIENLAKAVAATDNLPQVVKELNTEKAKRDKATAELEEANRAMLSANNAPLAFDSIKKAIRKTDDANLDKVMREMIRQLQGTDTRKRLLEMLPALVQRLEMNIEKGEYRIVNASGAISAWRWIGA